MKSKKAKDFVTKKVRVGKGHLRKYDSKDAKLLANVGQLKKHIKVATQSITVNKNSLNVTSRRLTLAELVGKSRHTSDTVRHHALQGISEFTSKYAEDTLLNLYTIVQVAAASLTSNSSAVRKQGKALLLSIISDYLSDAAGKGNKCAECISLFFTQAIISPEKGVREDAYQTIVAVFNRTPSLLSDYVEQLIDKLVMIRPETPTLSYVDCLYSLFKHVKDGHALCSSDLVEYLYSVIDYGMSKGESVTSEIGCLSVISMVVKSYKLLLFDNGSIKVDDPNLIQCLLHCDLFEYEGLTERGEQTFEALFVEFILSRVDLALKYMDKFTKYHLALAVPLIQLHSLRDNVIAASADRVASVLLSALSLDLESIDQQSLHTLKVQWRQSLYNVIPKEESMFDNIRCLLHHDYATSRTNYHIYAECNGKYNPNNDMNEGIGIQETLLAIFRDIAASLSQKQDILPLVALTSGVAPVICLEEFYRIGAPSHCIKLLENMPVDFKPMIDLQLDSRAILAYFMQNTKSKAQRCALFKVLLHISKYQDKDIGEDFVHHYLSVECMRRLSEDEITMVARILMNLVCSEKISSRLGEVVRGWLLDHTICTFKSVTELVTVMMYHLRMVTRVDESKGIDDHLMSMNHIIRCISEASAHIESDMNEETVDMIERLISHCISMTLDGLIRSSKINIWSVAEGLDVIYKRCIEPALQCFTRENRCNVALCILNTLNDASLTVSIDSKGLTEPRNEKPVLPWMKKLIEGDKLKQYSPVLLNRLKAANSTRKAIEKLCDSVSHNLI